MAGSGSIAILGVGFATFLAIVPDGHVWAHSTYILGQTIEWQFGSTQVVAVAAILCSPSSTA